MWNSKRDISTHFADILEKFDDLMEDGESQLVNSEGDGAQASSQSGLLASQDASQRAAAEEESELRDLFGFDDSDDAVALFGLEPVTNVRQADGLFSGTPPGVDVWSAVRALSDTESETCVAAPRRIPGIPPGADILSATFDRGSKDVRAKIVWQVQRLPVLRFLDAIAIPHWRKLAALIPRLRVRSRATGSHPSRKTGTWVAGSFFSGSRFS
jgi:hypothetical protein